MHALADEIAEGFLDAVGAGGGFEPEFVQPRASVFLHQDGCFFREERLQLGHIIGQALGQADQLPPEDRRDAENENHQQQDEKGQDYEGGEDAAHAKLLQAPGDRIEHVAERQRRNEGREDIGEEIDAEADQRQHEEPESDLPFNPHRLHSSRPALAGRFHMRGDALSFETALSGPPQDEGF